VQLAPAAALPRAELADWLRLAHAPGLGSTGALRLLRAFGLPAQVLAQPVEALARVVPHATAQALRAAPGAAHDARLARAVDWLADPAHTLLTLGDARYPPQLLQIPDPPPLLYASGKVELLAAPRLLALVGSRNPSAQGMLDAQALAAALAAAGVTLVSGMAKGIDAAAHRGALQAAHLPGAGSTIAVLGTGCDRVYPAAHRALAHAIAEHGLLLSEFELGSTARREHFPRRNRIISGLSRGVLVTEAALQSGSLITARLAAEQGRDVLAVPGSIHNPLARGCHRLLRDGAALVEGVADVLAAFGWPATADAAPAHELLDLLADGELGLDELAAHSGRDLRWLGEQLLELELQGRVLRTNHGRFRRMPSA
jgi:DNA processing protein